VALYLAADIMMATPLRQGAHLPALEYVAAKPSGGRVILSEFTGTAATIPEALIVNPYDEDDMRKALHTALTMPPLERFQRMHAMYERVTAYDHHTWLHAFLNDLRTDARTGAAARDTQRRPKTFVHIHGGRSPRTREAYGGDLR
jgi:trehalose 6-phosphate synthase